MSNPNIRCPLPPVGADPDSLRQFEGSESPKFRVLPLNPQTGGTTTVKEFGGGASSGGSSSGGSSGSSINIVAKTASATFVSIAGNSSAQTTVVLSQSFQILSITANQGCCVRLYGSIAGQTADSGRGVDAPAPAETTQGLIIDVVLDTSPFVWQPHNIIGANGDSVQSKNVYMTIINPGAAAINGLLVTISYVPLET
jgi:hypothetical protein